jgi:hypothetical protein
MKNKILSLTLLTLIVLTLASCTTSRHGRKGYGCPSTVKSGINGTVVEKFNS